MYITFSHPIYLLFLIGIPIILIIHFLTLNTGRRRALRFANFDAISKVQGIEFFSKNIVVSSLSVLTLILLVASAAGITLHREMDASSFSFVLAIDSSRSMEATDILPNRLEAAKNSARDFIDSAAVGTKIGIVSFSGNSVIEQDMTADKEESKAVLGDVQMSAIEGTDIYETVITSSNLLKAEDARAVILLSDGQINVGSIDEAIDYANKNDVVLHAIMIGTLEGGETSFGVSKADADSLRALAFNTGGTFFNVTSKEEMARSFRDLMSLTRKKVSMDISSYPLVIAIVLFVIEYFLLNLRYNLVP